MVQWLGHCAPSAGCPGSIPDQGTKSHLSRAPAAVSVLLIPNPGPEPCRWSGRPAPCACARGAARGGPALGASASPPAEASGCACAEPRAPLTFFQGRCFRRRRSEAGSAWPRGFAPHPESGCVCWTRQFCDGDDDALRTLGINSPLPPPIAWLEGIARMSFLAQK